MRQSEQNPVSEQSPVGDQWFERHRVGFARLLLIFLSTSPLIGCQSFQPLKTATQQKVELARQWTRGGLEAMQNGRLAQAKSYFSRAAAEDPSDQIVHANLARTVDQEGDPQQAIEHMRRAVEIARNDTKLIVELGELYLAVGQWIPAKRQADLAVELNHRFAPAWVLHGKTHLAKGNFDGALADFQRAAGLDPSLQDVQLLIVDTYQRKGQPLRALSAVEQLLSHYPPDQHPESAILAKSVALIELKQLGPAIDLLQTASERDGASSETFLRLGQAQLMAGHVSQARLTLNRAKQSFPGLPEFDALLTQLQSAQQRVAALDGSTIR